MLSRLAKSLIGSTGTLKRERKVYYKPPIGEKDDSGPYDFFNVFSATQLALQLHQERSKVVYSNKKARKHLTESNGTPAMDLWTREFCFEVKY